MFPFTHFYCTKKIAGISSPDVLYGSIFPDVPMTGIIAWGKIDEEVENFSNFIKHKDASLDGFADGLLLHEEPNGIDRFVHGEKGYAFVKGAKILSDIEKYFPEKSINVAHSFVEFAVDMLMVEKFPNLQKDAGLVSNWADENLEKIAMAFSEFFDLDQQKAIVAVGEFSNWLTEDDLSSREKAISSYTKLTNILRHTNYTEEIIGSLLEKAIAVVRDDYLHFLEETIEKCKNY